MGGRPPAWASAIVCFSTALEGSDRSPATAAGYVRHVEWLADGSAGAGVEDPWALTTRQLSAWINAQSWSNQTRRKVLVSLRTFYAWGVATGQLEWAPTAGVPREQGKARGPQPLETPAAWDEPLEAYLTACRARNQSPGTLAQHRLYLLRLAEVAGDPWKVTTQQLAAWIANPEWSAETKRSARSHARAFYAWAVKNDRIERSPAAILDPVHVPRAVPRPAPEEALAAGLAAADDRTRLMLMLAAFAGLRRAEIASLHCSQIAATHVLVTGKGGHQRLVPVDPGGELGRAITAELDRRRGGRLGTGWSGHESEHGWLFPSTRPQDEGRPITPGRLGRLVGAVMPDVWTTHTLRHRFATSAYGATRDLRAVQELLGHARPETTSKYAAVPDAALVAAVRGAGAALEVR